MSNTLFSNINRSLEASNTNSTKEFITQNLNEIRNNVRTVITNTGNKIKSASTSQKVVGSIIILALLGVMSYYIYKVLKTQEFDFKNGSAIQFLKPTNGKTLREIDASILKNKFTQDNIFQYTYHFCIYINGTSCVSFDDFGSYKYNEAKSIWYRGDKPTQNGKISLQSPGVVLTPYQPKLKFVFKTQNTVDNEIYQTEPLILNKWNHVTLVYNNKTVSIYINGELTDTFVLNNQPYVVKNKNIYVSANGGFPGALAYYQFIDGVSLKPKLVKELSKFYLNKADKFKKGMYNKDCSRLSGINLEEYIKDKCAEECSAKDKKVIKDEYFAFQEAQRNLRK